MKIRATWRGPLPKAGDYLMSQVRPRFAYLLLSVTSTSPEVRWDAASHAEINRLAFEVARVAKTDVSPHARVHPWKWDKRR